MTGPLTGSLTGKVALVTGASRGIGKGCALELGVAGATVYVTGRTLADEDGELAGSLETTVAEIEALGGQGRAVVCDHADDDAVAALFERIERESGRLDVLVNNAFAVPEHVDPKAPFWEKPISDWDTFLDVGTRSAYVATHHAARIMAGARDGLVVNISSAGAVKYFHHLAYGIGKAALDRFTTDAAYALAKIGVTVVSVWPFLVRTERVERIPGISSEVAESTRFVGRGVVALATDPRVDRWNGRAVTTRGLADEYGFTDLDGSLPNHQPWSPPSGRGRA